jgi:hypothetical protein
MDKIPTIDDFLQEKGCIHDDDGSWDLVTTSEVKELIGLHVEAALKAAKAEVNETFEGTSFLEERIGNCYPLNQIV